MIQTGMPGARNNLSRYAQEAERGLDGTITTIQCNGAPASKSVPFEEGQAASKRLGIAEGKALYRNGWVSKTLDVEIAVLFDGGMP